jgi:hypothetical protein
MIPVPTLRSVAGARLRDAKVLLRAKRFDGAFYLCGYAVEVALKARFCRTLRWSEFPETSKEFSGLQWLKTHDLEMLLRLSGIEARVRAKRLAEWSIVVNWNPEKRYQPIGTSTLLQATDMVTAATRLLGML